ncbi:cellulose binding domain-containing protein [Streptomonospora litoralis]|uniref:Exoglucanase A n=1 Tax=Streptomonospora litoralis TaxID=2498135 RepID=A0A4P6Q4R8_9ACTN|nr:cellulose binding domain-containing protein [Streptomonospora litoralis]QBI55696.1 Exoglucanase A precursor [Streptomonospora litoralis]
MRSDRRDPLAQPRRGAHRSEPADKTRLAAVGYFLGSTVPKKVQPPRLLNVLLVSGVTLALTLFGYSTTQIYLRFSEPPAAQESGPAESGGGLRPAPTGSAGPEHSAGEGSGGSASSASVMSVVSYQAVESSDTGFTGEVTVTNTGSAVLDDWELALEFADAEVTSAWDVQWRATENGMVAREPEWSGGLAPGDSVTVSFTADGRTQNPVSCSLNGHACELERG